LTDDTFGLNFQIIILVYAGELVWRERDVKLQGIFDAFPVPDWLPFAAKFMALLSVQAALLLLLSAVGIGLQAAKGYYHFQWGLYASDFLINFAWCFQLCALCMAVQVLVNHKYVGYALVILYYIAWFVAADGLGIEHVLAKYGTPVTYQYSDMNGYGHFTAPLIWLNLYYCALALLLALAANLFWVRGSETGFRHRRGLFKQRLTVTAKWLSAGMGMVVLVAGGGIFYRTNILNDYHSTAAAQARLASYERQYKCYEGLPQPKVTAVRTEVEIYPRERWYAIRGTYRLQNKSTQPIDTIILSLAAGKGHVYRHLGFNRPYQALRQDNGMGLHLYRLQSPLAPGDTLGLSFDYAYRPKGFRSRLTNNDVFNWAAIDPEDRITENGTFIERIPISVGYQPDFELEDDDIRQRNGLQPKERMAKVDDPAALQNNSISTDGDYIEYEAVVSTDRAQKAVTSGDLLETWERDRRRYFHYKAKGPMLNFYAFLSARYRVKRTEWIDSADRPVEIAVYYDKAHAYNVEGMIRAAKQSLAYYTQAFGPYQFSQLRILEFPRYKRFAQSFPNMVPFSEASGFIQDLRDPGKIDPVFYLTAHEIAHQWWGHQVVGGNVQGSAMLSESLAEYAALMVYSKQFGEQQLSKLLRWDLGEYLKGRHAERKKEVPLVRVENQPYIHYRKGSLTLYALQDYLGEARLNQVLRRFLDETRYQARPYPNSLQLVAHLREATPDSLQHVITDLFETITLFDNKLTKAEYTRRPDGRYEVRLSVEAEKMRADSLGNETSLPVRDWVDVGVFGPDRQSSEYYETSGKPLYLRKHRLTQPHTEITLVVDELPGKAGIDPYGKLIDENASDNVKTANRKPF
jgi:hypothetical protein